MFDANQLHRVLKLHSMSYELLRWVQIALVNGKVTFRAVHASSDSVAVAQEWLQKMLPSLPVNVRPQPEELSEFAHLFVSFLHTSFELSATSVRRSPTGCYCSFCSYLQAGPKLNSRNPSKKSFETARQLKEIYLNRLAADLKTEAPVVKCGAILASQSLHASLSLATWGAEMIRRSEFASQGEGVLALWREFAWRDGKPDRKFRLSTEGILSAEKKIIESLQM